MSSSPDHLAITFSPNSISDLQDILQYTYEKWGETQYENYLQLFEKTWESLQSNPYIGHKRLDIPDKYRAYIAGRHIVLYKFDEKKIYILRVLHSKMDFSTKPIEDL